MRLPDLPRRQWAAVGLLAVVVAVVAAAPFTSRDDSPTASSSSSTSSTGTTSTSPAPTVPTSSASPLPSVDPTRAPGTPGARPAEAAPGPSGDATGIAVTFCAGLMTAQAVTDLTGHPMGPGTIVPVKGAKGCAWAATDDSQTTVQALNTSSSLWAAGLPALTTTLEGQGVAISDATRTELAAAQTQVDQGFEVDADLACKIFQGLAQDSGHGAGTRGVGAVLPSEAQPRSIVVEACAADEYSYMQVNAPDLARDLADETLRTKQAVQVMHGAPLRF